MGKGSKIWIDPRKPGLIWNYLFVERDKIHKLRCDIRRWDEMRKMISGINLKPILPLVPVTVQHFVFTRYPLLLDGQRLHGMRSLPNPSHYMQQKLNISLLYCWYVVLGSMISVRIAGEDDKIGCDRTDWMHKNWLNYCCSSPDFSDKAWLLSMYIETCYCVADFYCWNFIPLRPSCIPG